MKIIVKSFCSFVFLTTALIITYRSNASEVDDFNKNYFSGTSARLLYLNNCARCHGANGKGDTELGRLNDAPDISGGAARRMGNIKLTRIITKGEGSMPGFGKKISKGQISALVGYVRGL